MTDTVCTTRLNALCKALGWQGGSIEQVAAETGCPAEYLLGTTVVNRGLRSPYTAGWFAARTNSVEFNRDRVFPHRRGDVNFWLGVAEGLMDPCPPLPRKEASKQ